MMNTGVLEYIHNLITTYPHVFIGIFLLYIFIYGLSIVLNSGKPAPNPFARTYKRPLEPLVTDEKKRDKILKQGFNVKKVPDELDAIVIGSGIGGLTTANLLARAGKKVLVLEQHDQAGGSCHTFIDKGFEFDIGIHYIGEMQNNTMCYFLCDQLCEGQIDWIPMENNFDTVVIGEEPAKAARYPIHAGPIAWKESLLKQFPDEEKALDKYIELVMKVRVNMLGFTLLKLLPIALAKILVSTGLAYFITGKYFSLAKRTLKEVLDELTENDDLKAVLAYNFGDYGCIPSETSFAMHSVLFNHYLYGASYPRGGASELIIHLIPQIERSGGRVLVRAPVSKIIMDKGKAVGVTVHRSSGDVDLYAKKIISTAGVSNTFGHLLPKEIGHNTKLYKLLNKTIRPGNACVQLFVGLRGTTEELGLTPGQSNTWYFASNKMCDIMGEYGSLSTEEAMEANAPLVFVSFPSAKDPTYHERLPGKSACVVVSFSNWEWFSDWKDKQVKKRGDDYQAIKDAIGHRIWEQTLGLFPQLADKVEYFDVGTPASQKHYLGYSEGETYGLDHNLARFANMDTVAKLRPETEIPGLYLSGQDVFSCGYAGAMFGGVLCASQIMNRQLYQDLLNLRKKLKKSQ